MTKIKLTLSLTVIGVIFIGIVGLLLYKMNHPSQFDVYHHHFRHEG